MDEYSIHCSKKATIHQVTTMLATPNNVLFPGQLATTRPIIKVSGHQHRWLASGYDLEIGQS